MKHAQIKELSARLFGIVTDRPSILEHFSTDQSIFTAKPDLVVYPQNTADVRKAVQFVADKHSPTKPLSIVPRGLGSDQGGAAVGEGVHIVTAAHLNKLLRLDRDTVTVQPGINFQTLQQTLHTHNRFIPQFPSSINYSTVGGAVASDSGGEKSVKYGTIGRAVKGLKVVLADGSLIETGRISGRELNRKKGLSTLEGQIYRDLDSLLQDSGAEIAMKRSYSYKSAYGYNLEHARGKSGGFDLTPIFVGSQGTLGIITEITLSTLAYNPRTTLVVGYFATIEGAVSAIHRLKELAPSALEMVDRYVLEHYLENRPGDLVGLLPEKVPAIVLIAEFDNATQLAQKLRSNRAKHAMRRHGASVRVATDPVEQIALWQLRRASAAIWRSEGAKTALPFMGDAAVPLENYGQLIEKTYKLLKKHDLEPALWGHAGLGNLQLEPRLDLSKKKDVDKLFSFAHEYGNIVTKLSGSVASSQNDGLFQAANYGAIFSPGYVKLLADTKRLFDPGNILNPSQKTGATLEYARAHVRSFYSGGRHHDFVLYA